MEEGSVELRIGELVVLAMVVFIAVVVAEMWIDQQRQKLANAVNLQLPSATRLPALVMGFRGGV